MGASILHAVLSSADHLKISFFKKILSGKPSVSNSLDPDQARRFVGSDLGPNCLQKSKPFNPYHAKFFIYYTSPQFLSSKLTRLKIPVV